MRTAGVAAVAAFAVSGVAYAAVQVGNDPASPVAVASASAGSSVNAALKVAAASEQVSLVSEDGVDKYQTERRETAALPAGTEKVQTKGEDGQLRTTYRVVSRDGKEISREAITSVVAKPRTDEVVLVGTGKAGTAVAVADDGNLDDDFARLAQCESGGNPRAVNPSGAGYYGLYQFSLSTWRSVGGSGNPIDASPEEQLMRAKMLQARSGWGQWGCGH